MFYSPQGLALEAYEKKVRQVMSIFIALESLYFCYLILKSVPDGNFRMHEESFFDLISSYLIEIPLLLGIPVLTLFSKTFYYIVEVLHILSAGLVILFIIAEMHHAIADAFLAVVSLLLFVLLLTIRFLIYRILIRRKKKQLDI